MRAKLPAVHALLALMLMQAARLPARVQDNGSLAILSLQDRSLWDQQLISLGLRHLGWSAEGETITSYHLQAEIAAKHVTAPSEAETDWPGIVNLYDELNRVEQTPIVALNAAIACSRAEGPQAGLRALDQIASDPALKDYHLLPAVRAQLWRLLGQLDEARTAYLQALECTCTEPERRFLLLQLDELSLSGASTGQR